MASDPPLLNRSQVPLPIDAGFQNNWQYTVLTNPDFAQPIDADNKSKWSAVPIRVVTNVSQLPPEILNPPVGIQVVIGFDCEGIDLCRQGAICVMQFALPDAIYLVDATEGGKSLIQTCKLALESSSIMKVIHDCKRDSEALHFQHGIKLNNVFDTQIAYSLIEEQEGRKLSPNHYISFVELLADPRYCGVSYLEKEEVRDQLRQDSLYWARRPMTEMMIKAAADDVRFLLYIYYKMMEKLNRKSIWHLAIRGSLHCRCFCVNDNDYADWPPLPPIPVDLLAEGYAPKEEILSILNVPPWKMGQVIGRKGASILSVKESCDAEIITGGAKGPPNTVFIIGPVREVRKAEALLRGLMLDV